jgi:alkanesulfonate monooxygenase SsuD/methylene tetrahydromethanopterin reductase-like flavin-dependent oxidoreductase (luciferase family)
MKIGMSLTSSFAIERDSKELLDNLIEQVELMAKLGFDSISLGDHHLTPNHYLQVLPTMSRLTAHSGDMQLLPLFLLPFYNPIVLAEQVATMDVLSGGRTSVICGLGHQPEVHVAMQTPQRRRVSRFVETFQIMRSLWSGDDVTHRGKHYNIESGISMNPKPLSQPLAMWIASEAEPAILRTAQMADGWVISPGWAPDLIEDRVQIYRHALEEFDRVDQAMDIVLRRDAHLASSYDSAQREAQQLYENGYRGFPAKELAESLIVGGPDECVRYVENVQSLGVSQMLFRCALDQREEAMQTIQVLGEEVIPRFR